MAGPIIQQSLQISRARPNYNQDGGNPGSAPRGTAYNEPNFVSMIPTMHALADEGSYFTYMNATPGTGVAHALVTSFTSTAAMYSIFNSAPIGGPNVFLDYLMMTQTATAPATSLSQDFLIQLDQQTNRAPTANNVTATGVNMNQGSGTKAFAIVQAFNAGSLTVPAQVTGSTRNAARIHLATGQQILSDENFIAFGAVDKFAGQGGGAAVRAVDLGRRCANGPPIMVAPQTYCTIFRWGINEATNTPSYEWMLGTYER